MADILVVGAHPDDAEFGMGASIVKFGRQGHEVAVCVLSRGGSGSYGTPAERAEEARRAARRAGAAIEILDMPDCGIFDTAESRLAVAAVIRRHRPRVIFAPYHTHNSSPHDGAAHPDHLACGLITRSAARYARFAHLPGLEGEPWAPRHLLYYMVPRHLPPSLLIDVSAHVEEWREVARCHESQLALRGGRVLEQLADFRRTWGALAGVAYAEAFLVEAPIVGEVDLFLREPPASP